MHTIIILSCFVVGMLYPGAAIYTTTFSLLVLAHQIFMLIEARRK
jgi:hypothetical protein